MLGSEAALELIALTTVVLCLFGTALGVAMVRRAWRRLRLYPEPGSRRLYAVQQLAIVSGRLVQTLLFLMTGIILIVMEESDVRSGIARLMVLGIVVVIVGIQVFDPISQSRIEYLREREVREGKERSS